MRKSQYRPWESQGISEVQYWRNAYLESRKEIAIVDETLTNLYEWITAHLMFVAHSDTKVELSLVELVSYRDVIGKTLEEIT